jgi:hypothetical protein
VAKQRNDDLFRTLRARGLRRKIAKPIASLDGNKRRAGSSGEKLARQAVEDLTAAVDDIRNHVLRTDRSRSAAGRKAAKTRKLKHAKRRNAAKKGAATRASVARTRARARAGSKN